MSVKENIDTDIAIETDTKYQVVTQEEREKIKLKYKNVERKLEMKRNKKWEKFRSRESNQNKQNKTPNTTSLLSELSIKIPSQNLNQNNLKNISTLTKKKAMEMC